MVPGGEEDLGGGGCNGRTERHLAEYLRTHEGKMM